MIHFGHGELAHGVFRVLWVAAGEVDVLDVAHGGGKDWGTRSAIGDRAGGVVPCEDCDAMGRC